MNKEEINKLTQKIESGDNMNDKYTVINKKEPCGQSVAENGIPCTARHCVTQLNGLFRDNEKLELKIVELESIKKLLYDLYEGIDEHYTETLENDDELAVAYARAQLDLITKIVDEVKKI